MYNEMLKDLKKTGYLVEYTNKAGATNLIKNPLAIEVTKTAQVLNQLLKSLGLTAAQRKTVAGAEGGDDFESF
jgi:P27 family predicted phage terminase small subunit